MFAIFGLIGLTIKIAILSTVYATVTFLILFILSRTTEINWIKKIMRLKFITWLVTVFSYTILLFCYAFSFWGYGGLGDYFCIPVGNGFVVSSIDAQETSYFEPDNKKNYSRQAFMNNFAIKDYKVCGEFLGYNNDDHVDCFIVFDTQTEKIHEFNSSRDYFLYATKNNLPQKQNFKNFNDNYRDYWGGIRNWFLP